MAIDDNEYFYSLFLETSRNTFVSNLEFFEGMSDYWGQSVFYKDDMIYIIEVRPNTHQYHYVIHYLYGAKNIEPHIFQVFKSEIGLRTDLNEAFRKDIVHKMHDLNKYLRKPRLQDYQSPIRRFYIR